jgi:hypothetical protein
MAPTPARIEVLHADWTYIAGYAWASGHAAWRLLETSWLADAGLARSPTAPTTSGRTCSPVCSRLLCFLPFFACRETECAQALHRGPEAVVLASLVVPTQISAGIPVTFTVPCTPLLHGAPGCCHRLAASYSSSGCTACLPVKHGSLALSLELETKHHLRAVQWVRAGPMDSDLDMHIACIPGSIQSR